MVRRNRVRPDNYVSAGTPTNTAYTGYNDPPVPAPYAPIPSIPQPPGDYYYPPPGSVTVPVIPVGPSTSGTPVVTPPARSKGVPASSTPLTPSPTYNSTSSSLSYSSTASPTSSSTPSNGVSSLNIPSALDATIAGLVVYIGQILL
ncbi:hypothetical protein BDF22DRAFT_775912 [Syncephalis plumigaleata]|nr:hypothetical protein BDF22DRAFT_775912 [Syncephalis plumigaleata]